MTSGHISSDYENGWADAVHAISQMLTTTFGRGREIKRDRDEEFRREVERIRAASKLQIANSLSAMHAIEEDWKRRHRALEEDLKRRERLGRYVFKRHAAGRPSDPE